MRRDGDALFLTGPDGNDWPVPIVRGFGAFVEQLGTARCPEDPNAGILSVFGYPIEPEFGGSDGCAYQRFERSVLKWQPGQAAPFDIVQMLEDDPIPAAKAG